MEEAVIKLKKEGFSFKKISEELSIPISKVRKICSEAEEALLFGECKNCKTEIKSVKGKKIKQFCSDRCRWDWWNSKQKQERKSKDEEII